MELPPRAPSPNPFQDFAGGGYFYLDNQDRAVVPTTERHVLVIGLEDGEFAVEQDYDLTGTLPTARRSSPRCPTGPAGSGSRRPPASSSSSTPRPAR